MKGDMERIRQAYGVPAKKGGRVSYTDSHHSYDGDVTVLGTITGARGEKLRIRLDGENYSENYHPTHLIRYLPEGAK